MVYSQFKRYDGGGIYGIDRILRWPIVQTNYMSVCRLIFAANIMSFNITYENGTLFVTVFVLLHCLQTSLNTSVTMI